MLLSRLAASSFVGLSVLLSIASAAPQRPEGHLSADVDPRAPPSLDAPHFVVVPGEGEGRTPSVREKKLQFWVEEELRLAGVHLVSEPAEAKYMVFIVVDQDETELEVTRTRPQSGVVYNSDGTWSTATVQESYASTESYVVRRVWIDVYSTVTREAVWQGYLGIDDQDYRPCPDAWIRLLASVYPDDYEGRTGLAEDCLR